MCCYGHVLKREDVHGVRRAFNFEIECQSWKGIAVKFFEKWAELECRRVGLGRDDVICVIFKHDDGCSSVIVT